MFWAIYNNPVNEHLSVLYTDISMLNKNWALALCNSKTVYESANHYNKIMQNIKELYL